MFIHLEDQLWKELICCHILISYHCILPQSASSLNLCNILVTGLLYRLVISVCVDCMSDMIFLAFLPLENVTSLWGIFESF